MKMLNWCLATFTGLALIVGDLGQTRAAIITPLDVPGAGTTVAQGVSGDNVVGWYNDSLGVTHGFLFDGAAYTTLDIPGADHTEAYGVSGSKVVGYYNDGTGSHGFLYDLEADESSVVPEPTSLVIWGSLGIVGLIAGRRRKRIQTAQLKTP